MWIIKAGKSGVEDCNVSFSVLSIWYVFCYPLSVLSSAWGWSRKHRLTVTVKQYPLDWWILRWLQRNAQSSGTQNNQYCITGIFLCFCWTETAAINICTLRTQKNVWCPLWSECCCHSSSFSLVLFSPSSSDYVYFENSSSNPYLIRRIEELNKVGLAFVHLLLSYYLSVLYESISSVQAAACCSCPALTQHAVRSSHTVKNDICHAAQGLKRIYIWCPPEWLASSMTMHRN